MTTVQAIRTFLFYLLLSSSAFFWCILCVFIAPFLPFRARYRLVIQAWCRCATWLAKVVAGIRYEVHGLEHIPQQPCVILAKHQSTWETFFLSAFFEPLSQVVKRELLYVPFFGWAMAMLKPIAIDRSNPKAALKQLAKQGDERIKQGAWVLIFPEGTRIPPGQIGKFSRGGAALAVNAGLPVLPIAHNAGEFWPKQGWAKYPGTIQVIIGPVMHAEGEGPRAIAELNERAFNWVCQAQQQISGTAPQVSRESASSVV
ncbi:lysophospholipid acyltransferase family protein [Pseudomonas sp. GOM6]|uniref:lysophospholipid acyltransferase family protein n=1 Tax=Pseudomonas sp. GOM6 TaxID=3036944 RepID=UPI002409FCA4|nr:lysophospholipid acyltransferase family protein [Pseudomonas sp. GOM6]MDG1582894.1 lysophospholipid acyltransferase family protein [Pseudomonas sp. GOM6]